MSGWSLPFRTSRIHVPASSFPSTGDLPSSAISSSGDCARSRGPSSCPAHRRSTWFCIRAHRRIGLPSRSWPSSAHRSDVKRNGSLLGCSLRLLPPPVGSSCISRPCTPDPGYIEACARCSFSWFAAIRSRCRPFSAASVATCRAARRMRSRRWSGMARRVEAGSPCDGYSAAIRSGRVGSTRFPD